MMANLASTGLKSKFRRHNRAPSVPRRNGSASDAHEGGVMGTINEHTSLLSRHPLQNADGQPLWEDSRPYISWPAKILHTTWQTLASNIVNVLLVFVPLGIIAGAAHWGSTTIFILNFLAIIPLASLLSFATEELSVKLGQTLGGLLNATFGNAVELIVGHKIALFLVHHSPGHRSALSLSRMARFVLSNPACLAPFCRTYCSSWAAASSLVGSNSDTLIRNSTKPSPPQCRLSWLCQPPL